MISLNDLRGNIKTGEKNVAEFINTLYNDTLRMYLRQHRDWYINERFVRGEHWIVYNKTSNKVQAIPINQGEIRRTVNKIKSQLRGVKNFIKIIQPRWECHPLGDGEEDLENARKQNKILQHIYQTQGLPTHLTSIITNGLKFSAGILEGGITNINGKDNLSFWVDDTFDIFFDPYSPTVQDCRYIIKAFKKPLTAIHNNPNYKVSKGLTSDNKEAAAEYKELLEFEKYNRDGSKGSKDLESVIVKELWIKWYEEGKLKVKVLTIVDNQLIRVYEPAYRRFPFFLYNPERDANSIYSNAWIKDLISINKSLDKTVSQVEGYIQRMLAGKYLIKQGVEVSSITDKGAEKIYYKGNVAPKQMDLQPLPSAPFTYMGNLERWLEELGGIREASLGRIPGSLQSGKAIEALQSSDAQTVAEPIENLEKFLKEVAEFSLEVIHDFQITSEEIVEKGEKIAYIGKVDEPPEKTLTVQPTQVEVKIVPEIAYSEESRKDWMMRLGEAGIIDPETILEKLSISNIGDIIERVKKHRDEKYKEEMMKQKESHRSTGEGPEDTADLADQENMQMAAGSPPPMTPQALWSPEHTELHLAFIQQNQDAYQQNKDIFDEHIQNEENYGR